MSLAANAPLTLPVNQILLQLLGKDAELESQALSRRSRKSALKEHAAYSTDTCLHATHTQSKVMPSSKPQPAVRAVARTNRIEIPAQLEAKLPGVGESLESQPGRPTRCLFTRVSSDSEDC